MHIIIQSSIHTLKKSRSLLSNITNDILSDHSVPPYHSCVGSHIRHITDFYGCIINGLSSRSVDLTARKRDQRMHCDCNYAIGQIDAVLEALRNIDEDTIDGMISVTDDLGLGKVEISYTLEALLAQANSHAIHHYAIINYMLDRLGVAIEDDTFGYNPTTPISEVN